MTAMKRVITLILLAALACCVCGSLVTSAHAWESIVLTDEQDKYPLGSLEYLEDPTGGLTIDDVTSTDYETRFILSETDIPRMGFTESAYWVRVHLRNEGHSQTDWRLVVQQPYLDAVDLYLPDTTGQIQVRQAGDLRPFDVREIEHRQGVFKVTMPPQSEKTLHLRLQSTGYMLFDLILWSADAFHAYTSRHQLFLGLFLGALCIMGAYNLFLFVVLGDRAYLHYVLFLFGLVMHLATLEYGLTYQYVWRNWMALNHTVTFLFPSITMFFALNFAMAFLQTKMYAPKLHQCMRGLRLTYLLLAMLSLWQQFNGMLVALAVLTVPTIVVMMIAGAQAWLKGYQPARYYILAWSMFWMNVTILILHVLGLVSVPMHLQLVPFTMIGMVLFLSLALADRINVLKQKTEQSKAETDYVNRQIQELKKALRGVRRNIAPFSKTRMT